MREANGSQGSKRVLIGLAMALASGSVAAGTITGGVAFPGDNIPALTVVAVDQGSGKQFKRETREGQRSYRMDVPPGRYIVFAIPHGAGVSDEPGQVPMRGAYSKFSTCVLSSPDKAAAGECKEHDLISVEVGASDVHKRIDIYDWYLPEAEQAKVLGIQVDGKAAKR